MYINGACSLISEQNPAIGEWIAIKTFSTLQPPFGTEPKYNPDPTHTTKPLG